MLRILAFRRRLMSCPKKQPSRELAHARAATRAKDAALPLSRIPQKFLSMHAAAYNTFNICRHLITSATKRRFVPMPLMDGGRQRASPPEPRFSPSLICDQTRQSDKAGRQPESFLVRQ